MTAEMRGPDPARAVARYRRLAKHYDRATRRAAPVRARAVAALGLRPGETVLDVACGTGVCFPLLEEQVGPSGRIIGVELSPEMLALARRRIEDARWTNVTLIQASMEAVSLPVRWDAALFHFTQDVLRSRAALANIFSQARDGARVAAAGTKLFPWWLAPLNVYVWLANRNYMTTFDGLRHPWNLLQRDYVPDLRVEPVWLGASYIATGCYRGSRGCAERNG
jgi:demethylmenaquinone methyltransferase/2-methoxy-6-polyprenyl-1,4-benzoquinol methylase